MDKTVTNIHESTHANSVSFGIPQNLPGDDDSAIKRYIDAKLDAFDKRVLLEKNYHHALQTAALTSFERMYAMYGPPSVRRDFEEVCRLIFYDHTLSADEQCYLAEQAKIPYDMLQALISYPRNV